MRRSLLWRRQTWNGKSPGAIEDKKSVAKNNNGIKIRYFILASRFHDGPFTLTLSLTLPNPTNIPHHLKFHIFPNDHIDSHMSGFKSFLFPLVLVVLSAVAPTLALGAFSPILRLEVGTVVVGLSFRQSFLPVCVLVIVIICSFLSSRSFILCCSLVSSVNCTAHQTSQRQRPNDIQANNRSTKPLFTSLLSQLLSSRSHWILRQSKMLFSIFSESLRFRQIESRGRTVCS